MILKNLLLNEKINIGIRRKKKKFVLVFVIENFIFVDCFIRYLLMERFFLKFFLLLMDWVDGLYVGEK